MSRLEEKIPVEDARQGGIYGNYGRLARLGRSEHSAAVGRSGSERLDGADDGLGGEQGLFLRRLPPEGETDAPPRLFFAPPHCKKDVRGKARVRRTGRPARAGDAVEIEEIQKDLAAVLKGHVGDVGGTVCAVGFHPAAERGQDLVLKEIAKSARMGTERFPFLTGELERSRKADDPRDIKRPAAEGMFLLPHTSNSHL